MNDGTDVVRPVHAVAPATVLWSGFARVQYSLCATASSLSRWLALRPPPLDDDSGGVDYERAVAALACLEAIQAASKQLSLLAVQLAAELDSALENDAFGSTARPAGTGPAGDGPAAVPGFTCPRCGKTSHHPKDKAEGYCGSCHDWTARPAGTGTATGTTTA